MDHSFLFCLSRKCRLSFVQCPTAADNSWCDSVTFSSIYLNAFISKHSAPIMSNNHFGWSLSDTVENPRRTGLANFRYKLLRCPSNVSRSVDNEDPPDETHHRRISEETTSPRLADSSSAFQFSRPVKPYYGRQHSVSQFSDSCFGSDYPSPTSAGNFVSFTAQCYRQQNFTSISC